MISIRNISTKSSPLGWHTYSIQINNRSITTFRHKREDGLAVCLERAKVAIEKARLAYVEEVYRALMSEEG